MNYLFHHNDMDGYASAAVILYFSNKVNFDTAYSIVNYTNHIFNWEEFNNAFNKNKEKGKIKDETEINDIDTIFIVDYSFTRDTICNLLEVVDKGFNVVWIDHHASSMEFFDGEVFTIPDDIEYTWYTPNHDLEYYREHIFNYIDTAYCGAVNCWKANGYGEIPKFLEYVDSWDTWKHHMPNTIDFKYYFDTLTPEESIQSFIQMIEKHDSADSLLSELLITEKIKQGSMITKYMDNQYKFIRNRVYDIEDISHKGLKACAVNSDNRSSLVFGDMLNDYDYAIVYTYDGKSHKYTYSIYSVNPDKVQCNKIAESYAGGGHPGAAGFTTKTLLPELV